MGRWVFPVTAPIASCCLELKLLDADTVTADDLVYAPKVLNLDHMLMLAFNEWLEGKEPLGVNSEIVVFDARPKRAANSVASGFFCCSRRQKSKLDKQKPPKPASLFVDVQILPKDVADRAPVTCGQISEPKGRVEWKTAAADPFKFAKIMLGPRNTRALTTCGVCSGFVIVCIFLLLLAYLFINTFIVPFN